MSAALAIILGFYIALGVIYDALNLSYQWYHLAPEARALFFSELSKRKRMSMLVKSLLKAASFGGLRCMIVLYAFGCEIVATAFSVVGSALMRAAEALPK